MNMNCMAPNFQSSFIPKGPITEEVFQKKKAGPLGLLAVSLCIISVLLAISLFVYKGIVKSHIAVLKTELGDMEAGIDTKTIEEMAAFSGKLTTVKAVISGHRVTSGFLKLLASSTVSTVAWNDFIMNTLSKDGVSVSLKGKANDYSSIALQESVFSKEKRIRSMSFSNLSLSEGGSVSFDLSLVLDPGVISYSPPVSAKPSVATTTKATASSTIEADLEDPLTDLDDLNIPDFDNL